MPRSRLTVTVHRAAGQVETLGTTAVVETELEVQILRIRGIIPVILRRAIGSAAKPRRAGHRNRRQR